jgi:GNAT superfamily N-acetyltransferase
MIPAGFEQPDDAAPAHGSADPCRVEAAGPQHAAGLVALFEAAGSPCHCRYWHFEGDKNAWLERCAAAPRENRAELERGLAAGSDDARGVVALAQGSAERVIGWLKVAPAAAVPKLYDQRLYRGLPCFQGDRAGVHVIGCALVDPTTRRRGVATALVAGAIRIAPSWGATALEALPRRPREPVSDEELWTGPLGAYLTNGFVEVHTFDPYPVLRRELRAPGGG